MNTISRIDKYLSHTKNGLLNISGLLTKFGMHKKLKENPMQTLITAKQEKEMITPTINPLHTNVTALSADTTLDDLAAYREPLRLNNKPGEIHIGSPKKT